MDWFTYVVFTPVLTFVIGSLIYIVYNKLKSSLQLKKPMATRI
jgi:hypothetical protein